MALSDYLVTDDLTVLLGLISATLFLVQNLYKPQPLVHPILLGRQSDTARVRKPGESAVYRNYGTGLMGRFPIRPDKDVHILSDLVRSDSDTFRTLWKTRINNVQLQDRVAAFGTGLLRLAGLQPTHSNVLLLLNDGLEFLISDLALASHSIVSVTVSEARILSPVLEAYPPNAIIAHAELLPHLLELIYDSSDDVNYTIIVVGEPSTQALASVASKIKVIPFEEVEREGNKVAKIISQRPQPNDIFSVSFYPSENGQIQGVQLTHENITAGVAATKALLPTSNAFTSLDTIVSSHTLSSGYGRGIAYTAVFEGTSFATLASSTVFDLEKESGASTHSVDDLKSLEAYPIPSPTVLFITPQLLQSVTSAIEKAAKSSSVLFTLARRHKLNNLFEGFITKDSLWDRLVYDGARIKVLGNGAGTLRAVIVSGGPLPAQLLTPARIALSVPLINSLSHALVAGPVLASHPLDVQDFPQLQALAAHVGPPSVNVEVKLTEVDDGAVEQGGDPSGKLFVRGPTVGRIYGVDDFVAIPAAGEDEGWFATDLRATVLTNGAFNIL